MAEENNKKSGREDSTDITTLEKEFEIYEKEPEKLIEVVKFVHKVLAESKEELEKCKNEIDRLNNISNNKVKEDVAEEEIVKNSKSFNEISEILERLEYGSQAEINKADTREEKFKVPSLRFAEINKTPYKSIQDEIKSLANKIRDTYGISIKLVEDIDKKNNPKEKFYILLEDANQNTSTIDLLQYQEKIYNFEVDEEESIKNEVVKLQGVYTLDIIKASKEIAKYISLSLGYKETFHYQYKFIGWDRIDNEVIFKYDTIYSNSNIKREGFCGEDWADDISMDGNPEGLEIFNRFYAHTFNNSVKASIILCAGVSGMVRQLVDTYKETNINMNIMGKPGSGKSTIQHLVLSFFGDPTKLEGSFIDSENANEQLRVERVVLPYMLDDRLLKDEDKNDKQKALSIFISIFREYEGKVKQRLGKQYNNSGLRTYGPVISSSVESILDKLKSVYENRDLGQYRRFIELSIKREELFFDTEHAEAADKLAVNHYGYGVRQVIKYMFSMMRFENFYKLLMENKVSLEKIFITVDYLMRLYQEYSNDSVTFDKLFASIDNNKNTDTENTDTETISEDYIEFLVNAKDLLKEQKKNRAISNKEEFVKNINNIVTDNELAEAIYELFISNKFTDGGDSRKLFNSLFEYAVEEVQETISSMYTDEDYRKNISPSRQRFALLVLTGHIINYSLSATELHSLVYDEEIGDYIDVIDRVNMHMDMDKVLQELITNLYNKLNKAEVINKETIDYRRRVVELYDWCTNSENMNILKGTSDNKVLALVEEDGNELEIWIQKGTSQNPRKINMELLLANLDVSAADMLKFEYGNLLLKNSSLSDKDMKKLYETGGLTLKDKSTQKSQIKGRRGKLYTININEIEKLRKELQSQEESTNETN